MAVNYCGENGEYEYVTDGYNKIGRYIEDRLDFEENYKLKPLPPPGPRK